MAGQRVWSVRTSFRELVLRLNPPSQRPVAAAGAPSSLDGPLAHLMSAVQAGDPDAVAAVREAHSAYQGHAGEGSAPAHHAQPPYSRESQQLERDLRRALGSGVMTLEEVPRPVAVAPQEEVEAAPPPARRAKPVAEPAPYDVKVIDDTGAAIAGIEINLTIDGTPETINTTGGGTAHSEGTTRADALLKILDVSKLPEKLETRWSKPRSEKLPKGSDVSEVPAGQPFEPLSVRATVPFTLILSRPPVRRVRMVGLLFDANKCFLLPQALPGIVTAVGLHQERPTAKVLIVGHAGGDEDLAGADIAVDRADIVAAYLTNKPDQWLAWFKPDKPARSRWGTREVQLMLSALPAGYYDGQASGVTDKKTRAAIKAFQKSKGLKADGNAGGATLKAIVAAYLSLEDTSLSQDITPVTHGCEGHFDDDLTEAGVQPDDRRLELFFFDWEIKPAPPGKISQAGSAQYPAWRAALVETRDFEHHGIHVQIIDTQKRPVPLAQVHLEGPIASDSVTDSHGFVSFYGLKSGEYTLSAQKGGLTVGTYKISYPTAKTVAGYAKAKPPLVSAPTLG